MELKKKLRAFFTLTRKGNGGFTLVELIVTIAILGILAGVGTVGYSGYVKSAKKKADQTLVSNIIRAIEVGTNSTMFVNDDSFKMGQMAYPIGFITLTASESTDSQVVTSKTEMTGPVEGECVYSDPITIAMVKPSSVTKRCSCYSGVTETCYEITTKEVSYCTTHSTASLAPSGADANYLVDFSVSANGGISGHRNHAASNHQYETVPAGTIVVSDSNISGLYFATGSGLCERAYTYQYGSFTGTTDIGAAVSGDTLYDAITAAFGSVEGLKLQYDGWTSEEGVDYATFYSSAPELMESVEELSGLLAIGSQISASKLGLNQTYENGEEVLVAVSGTIIETYPTEDAWAEVWDSAAGQLWDGWGFGLPGRETYSAARMGYNQAFASYMTANGMGDYTTYIENFYSQSILGVGLPGLICDEAFTDPDSPLKSDINNEEVFNQIAELYAEYKNSPACEENGRVLYKTLKTFAETADVANAYADMNGGTIYDYYNGYVNEIAAMYDAAQTAAGDGIVIIVTVEGGEVKCDVSPASADLRNK